MNKKIKLTIVPTILLTSILIGCNGNQYINKALEHDGSYYSFMQQGTIKKGTKYRFTATQKDEKHNLTYFGMCDYQETKPYFDLGYNDVSKTINVTAVYKDDGVSINEIEAQVLKDKENDFLLLDLKHEVFTTGNKVIIECTITKELNAGMWAYVGTYPESSLI